MNKTLRIVSVCINPVDDTHCARVGQGECKFYDPDHSAYTCSLFNAVGFYKEDPDDRKLLAATRIVECLYAERVQDDAESSCDIVGERLRMSPPCSDEENAELTAMLDELTPEDLEIVDEYELPRGER